MEDETKKLPPGAKPEDVADDIPAKLSETLNCNRCFKDKPLSEFSRRKCRPRGYHYACKECNAKYAKKYRKLKPYTENQLEGFRERSKVWRKQNPAHRNALKAAYKASKNKATPNWLTENHKLDIINMYQLAKELYSLSGDTYEVDHIVPIRGESVCGLHVPWNLQILPTDLNRKKSNGF